MPNQARRMGILIDPLDTLVAYKDTSLALAQSAQDMGWDVYVFTQENLWLDGGEVLVRSQRLHVNLANNNEFRADQVIEEPLAGFDAVLMRKDPPFDMNYIYSTYLLEMAEKQGVLVVNRAQSLRDCNEKLFATQFPQCCPPLLVSSAADRIRDFHQRFGDVVVKPLDGMGGQSIFRLGPKEKNFSVILETITQNGRIPVMTQQYLREIKQGDKRILMVDGEPVSHCLARIPMSGETRGNLAAGGTGVVQELSERDLWIAREVGPTLREKGLLFVGLDVIGDYLTEINVTSPTCVREIDAVTGGRIGDQLMHAIEARIANAG